MGAIMSWKFVAWAAALWTVAVFGTAFVTHKPRLICWAVENGARVCIEGK